MNRFQKFSPNAKVWIYPASRQLNTTELQDLSNALTIFCQQWTAHNQQLKANFSIDFNQIVVLSVDETLSTASGCSIDKSVHFLKEFGTENNINFFDRMHLGFVLNNQLQAIHINQIKEKINEKLIDQYSICLNYNCSTLAEFEQWQLPLSQHWIYSRIS